MLIADIKELPVIGDIVIMENSVHGEVESLKAVGILPDDELRDTVHVFFASEDPADNIHEENGLKYYCIRTYAPLEDDDCTVVGHDGITNGQCNS